MNTLRIATRSSDLALAQARGVAARIEAALGVATELVLVTTSGDRLQHVKLADVGGKGLFVKEIEEALLDGRADLAVHSAKDLPALLAPGLVLAACPERADARDALVTRQGMGSLAALARGARVGTGSSRRAAQLLAARPDLEIVPLRGNVPTRLRKLESESLDAVVLAAAGLERLGLGGRIAERIEVDVLLPALGQGTLALEARGGDPMVRDLGRLEDPRARAALDAERAFLRRLEGDCHVPLAGLASVEGGRVHLRGLVASEDGVSIVRGEGSSDVEQAALAGERAADAVLGAGGAEILAALRGEPRRR
ncbi:hydroxymethylbilane synthase [Myxococcaceae bacterium]|nr:hydroxymethylbilane synthase [Myxococcaceae bacterium]